MKLRLLIIVALTGGLSSVPAQVVVDGTVGPAGALTGPNFNIGAAAGTTRGNNLFHSFSQFDLRQGDSATFTGPDTIRNVLARVTGGPSTIDGALNCDIPGANFFFINPFGVIFGEHATVNVSGSFVATTADYVKLADGGRFDARNPGNDILTTAPVSAFGFLGPTPAPIDLTGTLGDQFGAESIHVDPGATVALIGGDIKISTATITASDGRIALVSVGSAGELAFDSTDPVAPVDTSPFSTLGNIQITDVTYLDVTGDHGGRVVMDGQNIHISGGSEINATASSAGIGLGVSLHARDSVELTSGILVLAVNSGSGTGGNIELTARTIVLDNSFLDTTTDGGGIGGSIELTAENIQLLNFSQVSALTFYSERAGNISIHAGDLVIDQFSSVIVDTYGGQAGTMSITANGVILDHGGVISAGTFDGSDNGGSIQLDCQSLTLRNGGLISVESQTAGVAGDITIHAATIDIVADANFTGINGMTRSPGSDGGSGGNIQITTESLTLQNAGAFIATSTDQGGGTAGNIAIHAANVVIDQGNIRSISQNGSAAGAITITATDSVHLQNGGNISVAAAQAAGGDITINAGNEIQLIDSSLSAQANLDGGNITLTAPNTVYLLNSQIKAESTTGNGGNITIDPTFVVLNNSSLIANAITGNGGNITIDSQYFLASGSLIDASSEFGLQGSIFITALNFDVTGNLLTLPGNPLDAESRLRPHCAIRLPHGASSFTVTGRSQLPAEPDGLLPAFP